ncbi:MAG TPA: protein kinase, partial [bacterium]|nr:protein kinase [bacterium]
MERVIGQYRILEEIGKGGTGTVFRAWHTSLKRAVALKLPVPGEKADAEARAAFLEQARAAAALRHPHIVGIVEVLDDADGYGYSMEYLDGPSLDDLLAGGSLEPSRALEVFRQVCR